MAKREADVRVDPETILEKAGVSYGFSIDYGKYEVRVEKEEDLEKLAEYMDTKLVDGCTGFQKGGWWWLLR